MLSLSKNLFVSRIRRINFENKYDRCDLQKFLQGTVETRIEIVGNFLAEWVYVCSEFSESDIQLEPGFQSRKFCMLI